MDIAVDSDIVDDVDRKLIEALRVDSRRSNTDIAQELGLSEGTVRKRIARLVRDGICAFRVFPDPNKFGYTHYLTLDVDVLPGKLDEVGEAMARLPELIFVGVCIGAFDIRATGLARSNDHVFDFMKRLNAIPGIRQVHSSTVIRTIKRAFVFPL